MDPISYAYADKQAQRIKKINANPDSTSGVVTVPKVIASGESVTVPVGRVAVLPNVQVDGELNIEGEVFIPSGATFADLDSRIALKANINSPTFTGTPTAPTPNTGDNSTKLATTAYVDGKMVLGTTVNSTSGTAIDFTGIPSWVKKITIMFNGVSTNGSSAVIVQIGSGIIKTTGYSSGASFISTAVGGSNSTIGFIASYNVNASHIRHGVVNILNSGVNKWVSSSIMGLSNTQETGIAGGSVVADGTLDRIRITTINGTDTFDAGSINIMYEG